MLALVSFESLTNYALENLLEILCLLSICLGLIFGLWDLFIFDVKLILFQLPEDIDDHLEIMSKDIRRLKRKTDSLYNQFNKEKELLNSLIVEKTKRKSPTFSIVINQMVDRINNAGEQIDVKYDYIKREIGPTKIKVVEKIRSCGQVITYSEIVNLVGSRKFLQTQIKELDDLLENNLSTVREVIDLLCESRGRDDKSSD